MRGSFGAECVKKGLIGAMKEVERRHFFIGPEIEEVNF